MSPLLVVQAKRSHGSWHIPRSRIKHSRELLRVVETCHRTSTLTPSTNHMLNVVGSWFGIEISSAKPPGTRQYGNRSSA
jgi:hypothetical protein